MPPQFDNMDDSLLQLALSINPTRSDPFDALSAAEAEPSDKDPDLFAEKVPPIASDPDGVDSLIASRMAKLSVDDREKVYLDVHGVPDYFVAETPEVIHFSLLDLQNEIELLSDKRAYNIAEKMDTKFVHDRDFRLAFLRCELFDCPKAALRIVRHFQMKLDLFGVEKLVMEITQDDLDVDGMDALHTCSGRFLNTKDRAGRTVNFMVTIARTVENVDAVLRKAWYNLMVTHRDEEAQLHGCVCVLFQHAGDKGMSGKNPELNWKISKLNQASPMRVAAIHWCYSTEAWREQQALSKAALSKPLQVRLRLHHGSIQRCLEELQGHGIDPASIPLDEEGEINDVQHEIRKMEAQRRYERLSFPLRSTINVPFSHDVLLGKGTPFQFHPGNIRLRELIAEHFKQYDKAQRGEKKDIAAGIIETIRDRGGLFLKQDGAKWNLVDDEVARLKVTTAFRTFRHSLKN